MQITERKVGNVMVIDMAGKLAAGEGAGKLKDKVASLVFQGEKSIVLNLGNLSYVDSAGLGEMIASHGAATRGGGLIKIANIGQRLQDLMVMTKLLAVFESHESEAAAVASFDSAG